MFTETALADLRKTLLKQVSYAQYVIDDEVQQAEIESASLLEDGRIVFNLSINAAANDRKTITQVQLFSADGTLLAYKDENILCDVNLGNIYYCFYFSIVEAAE